MLKALQLAAVILLIVLILPRNVDAASDFSSSYNVTYDFGQDGVANVTEGIVLKNLTDKLYASSFSLTIGATDIYDVEARDSQGPLVRTVTKLDKKTQIKVEFNQQVVGRGKEYPWTLKFKSKDFSQKIGNFWQITVPKVASSDNLGDFALALSVPVSFGDPASITPEPKKQLENGGKINFSFDRNQLLESGISANFGQSQTLLFSLDYAAFNDGVLPKVVQVALPSEGAFQEVAINEITPKPDNVTVDSDGNYLAWFKILPRQSLGVKVVGEAKLYIENLENTPPLSDSQKKQLLTSTKLWEVENPVVKLKLEQIFKDQPGNLGVFEKANLIYKFVANSLKFSFDRLQKNDYQNLGAATVLNNPEKALAGEFADLFVTLARAEGIPARKLIGFAYSGNEDLRPTSYRGRALHAWAQYYDPDRGWQMVDPAWGQTSGGVNYFSKIDLSHLTLQTDGLSLGETVLPNKVQVDFVDTEFIRETDIILSIDIVDQIFSGFPVKAKVKVLNNGNTAQVASNFAFSAERLNVTPNTNFISPILPPKGELNYEYSLKTESIWDSYEDTLQIKYGKDVLIKKVKIQPFFTYQYFSIGIISVIAVMAAVYFLVLTLFLKTRHPSLTDAFGEKESQTSKKSSAIKRAVKTFKKKKSVKNKPE